MKVLGLGVPELLIILAVALLIFGPKHLPKLGSAIGATVKNLRDGLGSNEKEEDIEEMIIEDEDEDEDEDEEPAARKKTKALESGSVNKPKAQASTRKKDQVQ